MTEKELLKIIDRAARDGRTELDLPGKNIKSLPPQLGTLRNLKTLSLYNNQITSLPPQLGELANLTRLDLSKNQLTTVPPQLGQLTSLTRLDLSNNQLSSLPPEIGQLNNLKWLILPCNQFTFVPVSLGQVSNLQVLDLTDNQITFMPDSLGKLTNLEWLGLDNNRLRSVPDSISQLAKLHVFSLFSNQLKSIPELLGQLISLHTLRLSNNQLTSVPDSLGQLSNLRELYLSNNQLTSVPVSLGRLTRLVKLDLESNDGLISPPAEVVKQGTKAILEYLKAQFKEKKKQWVSKLLFVGEGGVGKTSLLRGLRGEKFIEGLETTHGIGVEKLELAHPTEAGVTMELNTWDFGGQQIYHATHQFFLTNRALFVLVWDARHGWEAGKIYEWLDRIQAKAPESPVTIVAAHIDERDADLPLEDLRKKYPQIEGHYKVSNKEGTGTEKFRLKLAKVAADLPLMGEDWPASWLDAANDIRELRESYISPKRLFNLMGKHKIEGESANVLAQWMHDLGDILYFRDDEELNDTVILDPVWVTQAISNVLESKEVIEKQGILTRQHSDELWTDIDEGIRGHFLRLMERFDLSYRTLENREISLVVERLPLDPPEYKDQWDAIKQKEGCKEISMKFVLNTIPAGIPTWFIARTHRFTTHTHWRNGAIFADGKQNRHLALVESYLHDRYLRLSVRGPVPFNFFALLRDGLELTLARFPGLQIRRTIPCPGHNGGTCQHEFDLRHLENFAEKNIPIIMCPETGLEVQVAEMLFGLRVGSLGDIETLIRELDAKLEEIRSECKKDHKMILEGIRENIALMQRGFTSLFNSIQGLEESHCPNVFAVLPKDEKGWVKNIFGQKMVLQLYCQAPGQWHPAVGGVKGGRYGIKKAAEWLKCMGPYILKLAKVIKYAAPVAGAAAGAYAGPIGAVMGAEYAKKLAEQIKLMEELATKLSQRDFIEADLLERTGVGGKPERIEGMELRALRKLLDEVDPQQEWGGLKKVLTPEGHYLWLCDDHAAEYKK